MSDPLQSLTAPHQLAYTYKRSLGPVLGAFFNALRDRRIVGVRCPDGRVLVPPKEYDPETGEAASEMVDVSDEGSVVSWAWVNDPRPSQPLDHPFAYALVKLDGADSPMLHVVDVANEAAMATGMRVRACWAKETTGAITDIACFEPADGTKASPKPPVPEDQDPIEILRTPVELDYTYSAGVSASRFLRAVAQGKLVGQRCPADGRVYFPSRGSCPQHGVAFLAEPVELPDRGTVVTFSVNRVPSSNIKLDLPYAAIQVLLDGADTVFFHVLGECDTEAVHMGMRVEAVWKPREEWTESVGNIVYFKPLDEPDADFDSYKEHI